jgi:hypothetical protein
MRNWVAGGEGLAEQGWPIGEASCGPRGGPRSREGKGGFLFYFFFLFFCFILNSNSNAFYHFQKVHPRYMHQQE